MTGFEIKRKVDQDDRRSMWVAAVNDEVMACDKLGIVGSKKQLRISHVFRFQWPNSLQELY